MPYLVCHYGTRKDLDVYSLLETYLKEDHWKDPNTPQHNTYCVGVFKKVRNGRLGVFKRVGGPVLWTIHLDFTATPQVTC